MALVISVKMIKNIEPTVPANFFFIITACYDAGPRRPTVFAEISSVLTWIKEKIGDSNEETCKEGNCMTGDDLVEDARESFAKLTHQG